MVIEYLEKVYQELYERKLNLERDNQRREISLKDNVKFVETLENTLDQNYEFFSPRKVDNESHIKINALLKEQRVLEEDIRKAKIDILDLNVRISELESVLKSARQIKKKSLSGHKELKEEQVSQNNVFEIQEIERQRIARDMHDSVVQCLASLVHKIELCDKLGEIDPIRSKLELRAMTKNVREIIHNIREIIFDLRPMSLDDIGLGETIERELLKIRNYGVFHVTYEIEDKSINFSSTKSLAIFRIVQEICNNVIKHAKAENFKFSLKYKEKFVEIFAEDDGIGFDVDGVSHLDRLDNSGVGISMMRERIYLLGGELKFNSKPGQGTKIKIFVPINKEEK